MECPDLKFLAGKDSFNKFDTFLYINLSVKRITFKFKKYKLLQMLNFSQ